ncbi:MAG: PIG-L deacetylase family protein [Acidothermaceae bacterium]
MSGADLGRVLAVSPHLDDAVLSVGAFLAEHPGSVVMTVFAGIPSQYDELTEWDADSGFKPGDDVVALRREEDRRATAHLGARSQWLDFVDDQYVETRPSAEEIAAAIRTELKSLDIDTLAMPLGCGHDDHARTHEACALLLMNDFDQLSHWVAWADIPYRQRHPEMYATRVASLQTKGFQLAEFTVEHSEAKRLAIAEYPSQVRALGGENMDDAERAEQLYVITRE